MPTQHGSIWAQFIDWRFTHNAVHTYTLHPNNRDITAEAAMSLDATTRNDHWSETGISQIVSNGSNQTFDPPLPSIKASNVTEITFRTASSSRTTVRARHVINYWT